MTRSSTEPEVTDSFGGARETSAEVSPRVRFWGSLALLVLLGLGVADMGVRVDAVTLGMTECFKNEQDCVGERLDLAYLRIVEVRAEGFVLRGQGFDMEVVGWKGPQLPEQLGLARISVSGIYRGSQRMTGERGMVHRYRKVKEAVGLTVLLGWCLAVFLFVRRRVHG
jgi:hypothetical protein